MNSYYSATTLSQTVKTGIESAPMKAQKPKMIIVFLAGLLLGLAQSIPAGGDLYYAEVEIADESAKARQASIGKAFAIVLVKLTGNSKIRQQKGVSGLLGKSSDYVSQYRYRVGETSSAEEGEASKTTRYIQISFDKAAVQRALAEAGISIWDGTRPEILLWLAYQQQDKPRLLEGDVLPQAVPLLQQAANKRGLTLQLPLMDLQDQAALSANDVWTDNEQVIKQASKRYPHSVILAGKVTQSEGEKWNGSWILYGRGERKEFSRSGDSLSRVLERGMARAADLLAEYFAPKTAVDGGQMVTIRVLQVNNAGDYMQVMNLMRQQSAVSRVSVKETLADKLILNVWLNGSIDALREGLSLGDELTPAADVPKTGETGFQGPSFQLN